MDDMNIKNVLSGPVGKPGPYQRVSGDPLSDFRTALSESIHDVNKLLGQADEKAQEMALGQGDIHQAMMAMEEANISLRMLIQVRNKIVAAYEEIMRMQV
jgi:flagellar hook-basal body complex protein FliE